MRIGQSQSFGHFGSQCGHRADLPGMRDTMLAEKIEITLCPCHWREPEFFAKAWITLSALPSTPTAGFSPAAKRDRFIRSVRTAKMSMRLPTPADSFLELP